MTIILPLQYKHDIRLHLIRSYDDYIMAYEHFRLQCENKKAGRHLGGWQIAKGNIMPKPNTAVVIPARMQMVT